MVWGNLALAYVTFPVRSGLGLGVRKRAPVPDGRHYSDDEKAFTKPISV